MPIWLVTFMTNLITPIVQKVIGDMMLNQRLSSLENTSTATIKAIGQLASAKTDDERRAAIRAVAQADNS